MKHSFVTVLTLATMALASCSNDEVVNEGMVGNNEIKFNVISDPSSRAMESYYYTGLLKPDAFYVCANIGGETANTKYGNTYFALEKQERQNGDAFYTSSQGTRYWPTDGTKLNFFAHYNAYNKYGNEITPDLCVSPTGQQYYEVKEFGLPQEEHNQRDFIYAASLNQSRPTDNTGKVNLNFKHALAQLTFRLKCEDPSLIVLVDGLKIYNVSREGTMTFGLVSTNGTNVANSTSPNSSCYWTVADLSTASNNLQYEVDLNRGNASANNFVCSYVYYNDGAETSIVKDITPSGTLGGLMAIPQEYEAWTPSSDAWTTIEQETTSADGIRQAYIGLSCRVYHLKQNTNKAVNSENFFEFDGAKLKNTAAVAALAPELKYGGENGEFKEIVLPMPVMQVGFTRDSWQAGRRYVYTFKIGTGSNGGYDPENGDPVLKAISFSGGITEWIEGENIVIKE